MSQFPLLQPSKSYTVVLFPIELGETIEKIHGMLKTLPKAPESAK
jgi:hypothetical protein